MENCQFVFRGVVEMSILLIREWIMLYTWVRIGLVWLLISVVMWTKIFSHFERANSRMESERKQKTEKIIFFLARVGKWEIGSDQSVRCSIRRGALKTSSMMKLFALWLMLESFRKPALPDLHSRIESSSIKIILHASVWEVGRLPTVSALHSPLSSINFGIEAALRRAFDEGTGWETFPLSRATGKECRRASLMKIIRRTNQLFVRRETM